VAREILNQARIRIYAMLCYKKKKKKNRDGKKILKPYLAPVFRQSGSLVLVKSAGLCPEKMRGCCCKEPSDDPS
jgi:hypothetical protein